MLMSRLLVCVIAVWAMLNAPAAAQTAPQEIIALVQQGKFDAARAALKAQPHSELDRLFVEAQIFAVQGRAGDAIAVYRAMLSIAPGLIPVRIALADAMFATGDYDGARFHYNRLIELDNRPEARAAYARRLQTIAANEPSGFSAILSFTPSSNINRGSLNDTFTTATSGVLGGVGTISPEGQETSGIGVRVGGTGFLRYPVGEGRNWTLTGSAQATLYDADVFNVYQVNVAAQHQVVDGDTRFEITPFAGRVIRELGSDYSRFGVTVAQRWVEDGPVVRSLSGTLEYTGFDEADLLSGVTLAGRTSWQKQISQRSAVNGRMTLLRGQTEGAQHRYWGLTFDGGVSQNWSGGWATYLGVRAGLRRYDDEFTFGAPERADDFVALQGSVLNSTIVIEGFSPRINCLVEGQRSNIAFYDYNVYECGVVLTRAF
jgi:hypothetical protein